MIRTSTLSAAVGDGLVAGFVGTAAMTLSSTIEARLRDRAVSTAPARATAKALGIAEFEDDVARARFNDLSHWGYGTGWGVVRGLLGAVGLRGRRATAAHGAALWGSAAVALPALDVAPPFVFWGKEEVAIDLLHHTVYAVATGVAYEALAAGRAGRAGRGRDRLSARWLPRSGGWRPPGRVGSRTRRWLPTRQRSRAPAWRASGRRSSAGASPHALRRGSVRHLARRWRPPACDARLVDPGAGGR